VFQSGAHVTKLAYIERFNLIPSLAGYPTRAPAHTALIQNGAVELQIRAVSFRLKAEATVKVEATVKAEATEGRKPRNGGPDKAHEP
jgi:hypothetical protein